MDARTGEIHTKEQVLSMQDVERRWMKEMHLPLTKRQQRTGRVGRNEPCPCGSGKKFKKCCLVKLEAAVQ
jgi:uncharacterized protein YecA (UPF0149 family)